MLLRLHLYLFRQILTAFLFAGVAVTFVVLFTQSFRMLSFVIDNSSTLAVFLQLMGLTVPTFLPLIVPISLGVAILFIYHKLAVDSELVVMRSAGMSSLRLALPAFVLAGMVVAASYVLTLWVAPAANRGLVALQYKVQDDFSAFMIRPGAFNDLAEGLTFYARQRGGEGGFLDILVHDVRQPERPVTIMAEKGQVFVEDDVPQIVVFSGRRQEVDVETGRLQELNFSRYVVDLHLLRNNKEGRTQEPREMTTSDLLRAAIQGETAPKTKGNITSEIHQRFAGPLLALTFTAIGVTVILIGDFNRRGMSRRVLAAGAAIVILQAAMISLVMQTAKYAYVGPLLYVILLAPIPLCVFLLKASSGALRRLVLRARGA